MSCAEEHLWVVFWAFECRFQYFVSEIKKMWGKSAELRAPIPVAASCCGGWPATRGFGRRSGLGCAFGVRALLSSAAS